MSLHHVLAAAKQLLNGRPEDLAFNLNLLKACVETAESGAAKEELQRLVEEGWVSRAKVQQYGKPVGAKYRRAEIEYFSGAMQAIHAMYPNNGEDRLSSLVPVSWVVNPMTGRNVVEVG